MCTSLKKIYKKLPIHPSFFLLLFWFVITKNFISFIVFTSAVMTHEFGHYFVAKRCGYKLDHFYIAPYGVSLNYKEKIFENNDEILIALAGPAVNIFLSFILVTLWWVLPETYVLSQEFVHQSLVLGLFNLLPCYPLDGGRVFCGLLSKQMPRIKATQIACYLNYTFSIIFVLVFVFSIFNDFNPTLLLFAVFLILGNIDLKKESKYQPINLFTKKTKNFSKPALVYINGEVIINVALKHIEPNKFTVFVVKLSDGNVKIIDEEKLKKLATKISPALSFDDIFKRDME